MVAHARRSAHYRLSVAGLRLALAGVLTRGVSAAVGRLGCPVAAFATLVVGIVVCLYGLEVAVRAIRVVLGDRQDRTVRTVAGAAVRDLFRPAAMLDRD